MRNWRAWLWLFLANLMIVAWEVEATQGGELAISHVTSIRCLESDSTTSFLPGGLAFGPDGRFAIVDATNSRIKILDPFLGNLILEISCPSDLKGCSFVDVAMDVSGIYVSESTQGKVLRFDDLGNLRNLYDVGEGIAGIALGKGGRIYAVSSHDGLLREFPIDSPGDFMDLVIEDRECYPVDCAVMPSGELGITDARWGSVILVKPLGAQAGRLGDNHLEIPCGIAIYDEKYIFVCDSQQGEIAVFDEAGNLLQVFGRDYLTAPTFVACRDDGLICVADSEKMAVEVFKAYEVTSE